MDTNAKPEYNPSNMKHSIKFLLLLSVLWLMAGCAPLTPESFMQQYAQFVENLQDNHDNFTTAQWDEQYEKYQRFNDVWYHRFEDRLGMSQKIEVTKLSYTAGLIFAEKYGIDILHLLPNMVTEMTNSVGGIQMEQFETALDDLGEEIEMSLDQIEESIDGLFEDAE